MKKLYEIIKMRFAMKKNIIPRWIRSLLNNFIYFLQFFWFKKHLEKNKLLKDKYFGESVFVLGNGPSLNNINLNLMIGKKIITMNHFELHPLKNCFHIVAHCIGEPYKSQGWECPTPMIDGVKSESYWFNIDTIEYFSDKKYLVNYYYPCIHHKNNIIKGDDLSSVALEYQSTSQMAINVAIYLGFKKIYLLGFDHDWLATRGYSPHFYDESDDMNPADMSKFSYIEMIKISLRLFEIYDRLKAIAKRNGVDIFNLSHPSFLDTFPIPKNLPNIEDL